MNKLTANLLTYGIYGLLAACLSYLLIPLVFSQATLSFVVFATLMSVGMFACNWLELKAWATLSEVQTNNVVWRVAVRLCVYLGLPALLVWLTAFTGVFTLPSGFVTALGVTFMPLLVASYLNLFPAGARR